MQKMQGKSIRRQGLCPEFTCGAFLHYVWQKMDGQKRK